MKNCISHHPLRRGKLGRAWRAVALAALMSALVLPEAGAQRSLASMALALPDLPAGFEEAGGQEGEQGGLLIYQAVFARRNPTSTTAIMSLVARPQGDPALVNVAFAGLVEGLLEEGDLVEGPAIGDATQWLSGKQPASEFSGVAFTQGGTAAVVASLGRPGPALTQAEVLALAEVVAARIRRVEALPPAPTAQPVR